MCRIDLSEKEYIQLKNIVRKISRLTYFSKEEKELIEKIRAGK